MKMSDRTIRNIEEALDERLRELDREGQAYEVVVQGTPFPVFIHNTGWVGVETGGVKYLMPTVTDEYVMGIKEL